MKPPERRKTGSTNRPTASQPAGRKTTGRQAVPGRGRPVGAQGSNKMGLYIGIGVGAAVLILLAVVMLGGNDEEKKKKKVEEPSADEMDTSKPQWERMAAEGKRKCESAIGDVKAMSAELSGFAKLAADKRQEVLAKLQPINESRKVGFAKYEQAVGMSGGKLTKASFDALQRDWEVACGAIVKSLEREGVAGCEKGYTMLFSNQAKWTNEVPKAQQHEVHEMLRDGIDTIKAGMTCLSWINELTGGTFETQKYQSIMKAAIMKIKELE
jgi:hypothetical protein